MTLLTHPIIYFEEGVLFPKSYSMKNFSQISPVRHKQLVTSLIQLFVGSRAYGEDRTCATGNSLFDTPSIIYFCACPCITVSYPLCISESRFRFLTRLSKSRSHLPKKNFVICFNNSPSKMMKNAFYFILKALFVLKIIELFS